MNARRPHDAGGFGRGAPPRRAALIALALAALGLGGCANFNFPSLCGPCRPRPLQAVGQRIFNHKGGGCNDCGEPGLIAAPALVETLPGAIVAPAPATVVPGVPVLPVGPPAAAGVPPAADEPAPIDLRPLDETSNRRGAPAPRVGLNHPGDGLARTGAERSAARPAPPGDDPLRGFIPRLEAPIALEPVPGPDDPGPGPVESPPPATSARIDAEKAEEAGPTSSPSPLFPPDAATEPDGFGTVSRAPGIRKFKQLDPGLSAGSLPDSAGLAWLVEQGYRTVVDLRPADQFRHEDSARINQAGLRLLLLPIPDEAVGDPAILKRFGQEIDATAQRPLYLYDGDGSRTAVMWYLHRMSRNAAPQDAGREADEIGPRDLKLWARANAYLDRLRTPAPAPSTTAAPEPPAFPVPDAEPNPAASARIDAAEVARDGQVQAAALVAETRARLEGGAEPPALHPVPEPPAPHDPTAWKPFAMLAASGLTVPLFFFGRNALGVLTRPKASRAARAQSRKSLPGASGA